MSGEAPGGEYKITKLDKKILSRGPDGLNGNSKEPPLDFDEPIPSGKRQAKRKRKDLSVSEQIQMVHEVLV